MNTAALGLSDEFMERLGRDVIIGVTRRKLGDHDPEPLSPEQEEEWLRIAAELRLCMIGTKGYRILTRDGFELYCDIHRDTIKNPAPFPMLIFMLMSKLESAPNFTPLPTWITDRQT